MALGYQMSLTGNSTCECCLHLVGLSAIRPRSASTVPIYNKRTTKHHKITKMIIGGPKISWHRSVGYNYRWFVSLETSFRNTNVASVYMNKTPCLGHTEVRLPTPGSKRPFAALPTSLSCLRLSRLLRPSLKYREYAAFRPVQFGSIRQATWHLGTHGNLGFQRDGSVKTGYAVDSHRIA